MKIVVDKQSYCLVNWFAIFGWLLLIFPVTGICQSSNIESSYQVTVHAKNKRILFVEWVFELTDSLLYMEPGAEQFPKGWAKFVEGLEIHDDLGTSVGFEPLDGARWRVNADPGQKLIVRYALNISHEDYDWSGGIDGIAYVKPWGVFCSGRSLFIMNGQHHDLNVAFNLPQNWKVSSSWEEASGASSFKVANHTALSNALFFVGEQDEIIVKRNDFELIFALGGRDITSRKEEFKNLAEGVLDYYINLFGGVPNPPPGQELKKALVIINSGDVTDGEVVGNDISILIEPEGNSMSRMISRFIFAHEFFHLWNGKSFTPGQEDTEWFKEGFTNYYTLKALFQVGALNEQSYFDMLAQFFYARYNEDEGAGALTMSDGSLKHNHWGLIYSGGLMVGIMQDIQIRQASDNRQSIDDLMRHLYVKYGGTNEVYDITELQELLSALNGESQELFFQNYIIGTQRLPFAEYLNRAGLSAELKDNKLMISLPSPPVSTSRQNIINGLLGK